MMVDVKKVYDTFIAKGVDFFTGVPDSLLQSICAYITDYTPKEKNIIAANEGAAVGIAAGYYLASNKILHALCDQKKLLEQMTKHVSGI